MAESFQPGDRVRLLLDCQGFYAGTAGIVGEDRDRKFVRFDGCPSKFWLGPEPWLTQYLEVIPDERPVQLTFDWWLNFGDWKGERGDPDDK